MPKGALPSGRAIVTPPPGAASQGAANGHQMVTLDSAGSHSASVSVTPNAS